MEMTKNPNLLVAKKNTKEKLKEWYVKNFSVTKENDILRKIYSTYIDIKDAVGSVLLSIFAPEFTGLIPLTKVKKELQLKAYDGLKSAADQAAGVEIEDDQTEGKSYLDEKDLNSIKDAATNIITSLKKEDNGISNDNLIEEKKGRSL